MKNKIYLIIFVIMTSTPYLFSDVIYYISNEIGMRLEEINPDEKTAIDYMLEVESLDNSEHRKLLTNGSEIKRWETTYYNNRKVKEEKEFKNGSLNNIKFYDRKARLNKEEVYSDGVLKQKTIYQYSNEGRLSNTETFDYTGTLLYREDYLFSIKGTLREVKRTMADGSEYFSSFIYSKDRVIEEIFYFGNEMTISRYNSGIPRNQEVWKDGEVIRIKTYSYTGEKNILSSISEEELLTGLKIEKMYNKDGQLIKEVVIRSSNIIKELKYSYNKEGRIQKLNKKSDKGTEEWKYSYDKEGELKQEDYYLKGFLIKKVIYTNDNLYYEELYRESEPVIRIYYEDDKKIREEIIEKGEVFKVRKLNNEV